MSRRNSLKMVGTLAALCALAAGVTATASTASAESDKSRDVVQSGLNDLVGQGFPAALAAVHGRDGRNRNYTAGVGDVETNAKVPVDGQVRIGSNTKTFTAVAVLQLVGEGKIDLAAPIEKYLPNLLRGQGIDGRNITVHQLLQHTSGLPDYTDTLGADISEFQHTYLDARTLIDRALAKPATSVPGTAFSYSNTNYIVAGLLLEKVTGRPVMEVITNRVIKPAGLHHTYYPPVGEERIRERHAKGYDRATGGKPLRDVDEIDGSWAGAAGQMVSTPTDVNAFFSALLGGKLLPPAQLAQMRTTVEATGQLPGERYGLGLSSTPLKCGGLMWGHGGDIFGYHTVNGVTDDGRGAALAVTALPKSLEEVVGTVHVIEDALCK
ncbi:serine hydrolase domain-containing protein [Amycolatopsis sp.]|uniref:serine hydrolase domain-containing protein n=1 Tax=Amycolatopsis sp. TaxID=37632 RepID=UPI002E0BE4D9|nr:serine hydrolase domain-containing protein [Amycolatopsis sp.]